MHRLAPPLVLCCTIAWLSACHHHDSMPVEPVATPSGAAPAAAHSSKAAGSVHAAPAAAVTAPAAAARTGKAAASDDSFRVATVTLGSAIDASYAVTTPASRFADDTPVIYASVATTGRTASALLEARWRYLEGRGVLVNELSQAVSTDGPAVTTFEVRNPNRWPAGRYNVQISLDGKPVAQQAFEVTNAR